MISFQSSVFSYPTFSWYKSIWPFDFTMHPRSLVFHLAKMTTVLPHKHSIQLLNDSDDLIMVVARINFEIALANFFVDFLICIGKCKRLISFPFGTRYFSRSSSLFTHAHIHLQHRLNKPISQYTSIFCWQYFGYLLELKKKLNFDL